MSNYIEEKLIDIYESDDYKEAVREQMFGLLSFKKEEQFNAYIDVLMIILRNHIHTALQEQEERIREEMKKKVEKQIKHYEELQEEIRSMRESNRNETRIIDSEQTEFAKALCGHYECLMCGNMVNGFNKYCPHCGRINKDY